MTKKKATLKRTSVPHYNANKGRVEKPKEVAWQPCPRCGSAKVVYRGGQDIFLRGLMFTVIMGFVGFLTIPFLIGIPLIIGAVLIFIVAIGMSSKPNIVQGQCKTCSHMWYPR